MADITIAARDGGSFDAYLAAPASSAAAAVVVIQEIFGVNRVMRDLCAGFAAQGYFALCPDMFWRLEPGVQLTDKTQEEWDQAFMLMQKFDHRTGVEDLAASIAHARGLDGCAGKVGAVGFCFGGGIVNQLAVRLPYLVAAVPFYGGAPRLEDVPILQVPVLGIYAGEDSRINGGVPALEEVLKAEGKDYRFITYPGASHAFFNDTSSRYHPQAAGQAWNETLNWFEDHLMDP